LWAILVVNLAFPYYGAGLLGAYMANELHFDRGTLGLCFAIFQWTTALPAPLVALCLNRKGVRFTLVLGSALLCLGSFLMAVFAHSAWQVYVAFGGVVGTGVLTGSMVATQTGIGRWFEKRKALAISVLLTGPYIGGFIAPLVLNWVVVGSGGHWRSGWGLMSALSLLAAVLALVCVKESPAELGQYPDGGPVAPPRVAAGAGVVQPKGSVYRTAEDWSFPEVLRSPQLWLLVLAAVGFSTGLGTFLSHGIIHLRDLGHTAGEAALALSVMSLASLAGTLVVAGLGDRIEPRLIFSVASAVGGLGYLLALHAAGTGSLYLCVVLLGVGLGACPPCLMTIPANYFGNGPYASIVGLLSATGPTAGAIAAWGAGFAYSQLGSYRLAFNVIAATCFAGAVLALLATPPLRRAAPAVTLSVGCSR
jgi:MFS family permease